MIHLFFEVVEFIISIKILLYYIAVNCVLIFIIYLNQFCRSIILLF